MKLLLLVYLFDSVRVREEEFAFKLHQVRMAAHKSDSIFLYSQVYDKTVFRKCLKTESTDRVKVRDSYEILKDSVRRIDGYSCYKVVYRHTAKSQNLPETTSRTIFWCTDSLPNVLVFAFPGLPGLPLRYCYEFTDSRTSYRLAKVTHRPIREEEWALPAGKDRFIRNQTVREIRQPGKIGGSIKD